MLCVTPHAVRAPATLAGLGLRRGPALVMPRPRLRLLRGTGGLSLPSMTRHRNEGRGNPGQTRRTHACANGTYSVVSAGSGRRWTRPGSPRSRRSRLARHQRNTSTSPTRRACSGAGRVGLAPRRWRHNPVAEADSAREGSHGPHRPGAMDGYDFGSNRSP